MRHSWSPYHKARHMKTLPKINFINLISDFNQATWKKYKKKISYMAKVIPARLTF